MATSSLWSSDNFREGATSQVEWDGRREDTRARTSLGRFKIIHTNKILDGYKTDIDRNLQKTKIVAVSVVVLFFPSVFCLTLALIDYYKGVGYRFL